MARPLNAPVQPLLPEAPCPSMSSWTTGQRVELARQMQHYTMIQSAGTANSAAQPSPSVPTAQPYPSVSAAHPSPSVAAAALPSLLSLHLQPPTQQTRTPRSQPTSQQTLSCNDCRYRCSDFRNLDLHIATKHQRPHHTTELTLLVGDSQMKTVNCRVLEAALSGGKIVCGEHIATKPPGRRSPRAGKPGRAYNSVSSWPNAKYTESSLETVVPPRPIYRSPPW